MHLFELTNVSRLFSNLFFYDGVWGLVQKEFLHWSGAIGEGVSFWVRRK